MLAQTSMPGVLVETGFISNPEEEKYLMTDYGQDIIASAIYRGFREYKEEIDRRSNLTVVKQESPPPEEAVMAAAGMETDPDAIPEGSIVFSVQLASSRNKIVADPSSFKGYRGVRTVQDGRWFKYLYGVEAQYHDALDLCNECKKDFPDAFVVASRDGKLIPISEALVELNR
mgnify:CR=1 FL=1